MSGASSGDFRKGWCPSALRPMASGDGLILRLRVEDGRLTLGGLRALAALAGRRGSGVVELTRRGSVQLRGLTEASWRAALEDLAALDAAGALPFDPGAEARPAFLTAPDPAGDALADALRGPLDRALRGVGPLPAKLGVALDLGPAPLLADTPADLRLERGLETPFLVAADGAATGFAADTPEDAAAEAARLLMAFAADPRVADGRVRRVGAWIAADGAPARHSAPRRAPAAPPPLGPSAAGLLIGLPFGRADAPTLAALADRLAAAGVDAVRVTPWRAFLAPAVGPHALDPRALSGLGLLLDPADPLARVDACVGAPGCASAEIETLALARAVAGTGGGRLHVSGCAKGCARDRAADVTLVGRAGRIDLVRHGRAGDTPRWTGLTPARARALIITEAAT